MSGTTLKAMIISNIYLIQEILYKESSIYWSNGAMCSVAYNVKQCLLPASMVLVSVIDKWQWKTVSYVLTI